MGKYKHHSGSIGGGVNLSKGKTPHDKDIKDMPLFKMDKYSMGTSMRGPLDKMSGKAYDNKMAYNKNLTAKARFHYLENEERDDRDGVSMKHSHKGPSAYGKKHSGPSKMDPMYNGKPGVQKDDFKQFASPATRKEDEKKGKMEKKLKCKPGFKMHNGECVKIGTKVSQFSKK